MYVISCIVFMGVVLQGSVVRLRLDTDPERIRDAAIEAAEFTAGTVRTVAAGLCESYCL
jgi:hypothetical protein